MSWRLYEDDEAIEDEDLKFVIVGTLVDHFWTNVGSLLKHIWGSLLAYCLFTFGQLFDHVWKTVGALVICVLSLLAAS
eukprot:16430571-Heterocapsa_arctica.AAC.1